MARTRQAEPPINFSIQIECPVGWTNPILVGADDDVIAGHARLMAARKLGMKDVKISELLRVLVRVVRL